MLQVDKTLKLQVKIKRPEFTLEASNIWWQDKTIWKQITMANNAVSEKITIAYWCNLGFEKFHIVASSSTKVGTCEKNH